MTENPYEPPPVDEPANESPGQTDDRAFVRVLVCFPLPALITLVAWFLYPFFYFWSPAPILQLFVSLGAIVWALALTEHIVYHVRRVPFQRPMLVGLQIFAIVSAWPLGIEFYLLLGFPEPMP